MSSVAVADLRFTYDRARTAAVDGMTFAVESGEIFGLLGPSGAGKTTTQRILLGLLRGYTGSVEVLGRPRSAWGAEFFERVGVSFELPAAYAKLTVEENLRFFAGLYRTAATDIAGTLEAVGLSQAAGFRAGQLSKGMRIRLNLARSMLHRPDLLFLDEPTAGLDPVTAMRITALIATQRERGATVLLTTHDMHLAQSLCDRVGFVVGGRLLAVDAPSVLCLRYGSRQVRVTVERDGGRDDVHFPLDGLADDRDFLRCLREDRVVALHSREATLDEVFREVTGSAL